MMCSIEKTTSICLVSKSLEQGINQTLEELLNSCFPIEVSWVLSQLGLPKISKSHKIEKYYWFFVHNGGYKLQFDYDHLLITILH